ncbi:MAG TPA: 50S ribosomal protein L24 [Patescibacteria group bacterium]|nr:50S ribosomal protein L24 [Patescibacteria group bacterium]
MKIKKDDKVKIISGKDKGRKGKILKVLPNRNKVVVEGLNTVTKHIRPKKKGEKGQRVKMAMPINVSNVKLICPECGKAIRVGYKILSDGRKKRFCRDCKNVFK